MASVGKNTVHRTRYLNEHADEEMNAAQAKNTPGDTLSVVC